MIVSDADVLGTNFAAQKSYLRCYGVQDLPETFNSDSNLMKAHGLNGESEDVNGKRVLLVVQQLAIIAKGQKVTWRPVGGHFNAVRGSWMRMQYLIHTEGQD
ncbi:hypothetical protein Vi05172_g4274 [Venturia inaequalis]|nr:hypothetical protein Vi05172_g4274 [Venturia inaequalis]